jgi:hypothetical protein
VHDLDVLAADINRDWAVGDGNTPGETVPAPQVTQNRLPESITVFGCSARPLSNCSAVEPVGRQGRSIESRVAVQREIRLELEEAKQLIVRSEGYEPGIELARRRLHRDGVFDCRAESSRIGDDLAPELLGGGADVGLIHTSVRRALKVTR